MVSTNTAAAKKQAWDLFYLNNPITAAVAFNKLYKKDLFKCLRYPDGKLHEDEFLTYKILYRAGEIAYLPVKLYYYYQNSEGIMKRTFTLKRLDAIEALGEQCMFLKGIGSKELYYNRTKERLVRASEYVHIIKNSPSSSEPEWIKAKKYLQTIQKQILMRDGKKIKPIVPREEYQWIYDELFPVESWVYWTCKGIWNKLKRMVDGHANN